MQFLKKENLYCFRPFPFGKQFFKDSSHYSQAATNFYTMNKQPNIIFRVFLFFETFFCQNFQFMCSQFVIEKKAFGNLLFSPRSVFVSVWPGFRYLFFPPHRVLSSSLYGMYKSIPSRTHSFAHSHSQCNIFCVVSSTSL